jgi:sugar O-acyltransferase (sialic acid O-acetyltransferase NeuD family)
MKSKEIYIVGNTNAAQILFGFLKDDSRYHVIGFAVHQEFIHSAELFNLPVVNFESLIDYKKSKDFELIMGIGYSSLNSIRENIFFELLNLGFSIETYIHPTAFVSSQASIGKGCVILPNAVIEPFSEVDDNTYICSNSTIAHHSRLGRHVWVASNSVISGEAIIEDNTFIGVGTTVVNKVIVGKGNILGAGSLILKNTKPDEVYLSRNSEKHRFSATDYSTYFWKD